MSAISDPTFKLEGVVRSRESMEDFEGPLALILQLLSKNKIEIRDVKISLILDQYLAWMNEMRAMDLEVASEFAAMASHLMYIKARTLLTGDEEESEMESLISSLEALKNRENYTRIKSVTDWFSLRAQSGFSVFTRAPVVLGGVEKYRYRHEAEELSSALYSLLGRDVGVDAPTPGFVMPTRVAYPIGLKTEELVSWLRDAGKLGLGQVFAACHDRSELIASFMAVLEICRSGSAELNETEDGWELEFMGSNADEN